MTKPNCFFSALGVDGFTRTVFFSHLFSCWVEFYNADAVKIPDVDTSGFWVIECVGCVDLPR